MGIKYNQQSKSYSWEAGTSRPQKPKHFSVGILNAFLETSFAQNTTLANFITSHPKSLETGVLNQLHRRHIISWDTIKNYTLKCATLNWNRDLMGINEPVFKYFHIKNAPTAMIDGQPKATAWEKIANQICWVDSNVFVGPSYGNHGVDIDQADGMDNKEALKGTPWRNAGDIESIMKGVIDS